MQRLMTSLIVTQTYTSPRAEPGRLAAFCLSPRPLRWRERRGTAPGLEGTAGGRAAACGDTPSWPGSSPCHSSAPGPGSCNNNENVICIEHEVIIMLHYLAMCNINS